VASRRLFPLTEKSDPAQLRTSQTDGWTSLASKAEALLQPSNRRPLGAGLFRKFRLRCSYSDGDPILNQPQLQLRFLTAASDPYPGQGLQPATLTLPRAATVVPLCSSSTTEWFSLAQGSQHDLSGNTDRGATLQVRLKWITGADNIVASLYEVVLECWDFTSPNTGSSVTIIHESTLVRSCD